MFTISLIYSHSSIYDPQIMGLTAGGGPIFTVVHIYVQLHWWYIICLCTIIFDDISCLYICTIILIIYHIIYMYIDNISYVPLYIADIV